MDNAGYKIDGEPHSNVELGSLVVTNKDAPRTVVTSSSTTATSNGHATQTMGCSEACYNMHEKNEHNQSEKLLAKPAESPWHHLKTIFLIGTIVFLALWVLIYTILSQLNVL